MGLFQTEDLFPKIQDVGTVRIDRGRREVTAVVDGVDRGKCVFRRRDLVEPGSSKVLSDGLQWTAEDLRDSAEVRVAHRRCWP